MNSYIKDIRQIEGKYDNFAALTEEDVCYPHVELDKVPNNALPRIPDNQIPFIPAGSVLSFDFRQVNKGECIPAAGYPHLYTTGVERSSAAIFVVLYIPTETLRPSFFYHTKDVNDLMTHAKKDFEPRIKKDTIAQVIFMVSGYGPKFGEAATETANQYEVALKKIFQSASDESYVLGLITKDSSFGIMKDGGNAANGTFGHYSKELKVDFKLSAESHAENAIRSVIDRQKVITIDSRPSESGVSNYSYRSSDKTCYPSIFDTTGPGVRIPVMAQPKPKTSYFKQVKVGESVHSEFSDIMDPTQLPYTGLYTSNVTSPAAGIYILLLNDDNSGSFYFYHSLDPDEFVPSIKKDDLRSHCHKGTQALAVNMVNSNTTVLDKYVSLTTEILEGTASQNVRIFSWVTKGETLAVDIVSGQFGHCSPEFIELTKDKLPEPKPWQVVDDAIFIDSTAIEGTFANAESVTLARRCFPSLLKRTKVRANAIPLVPLSSFDGALRRVQVDDYFETDFKIHLELQAIDLTIIANGIKKDSSQAAIVIFFQRHDGSAHLLFCNVSNPEHLNHHGQDIQKIMHEDNVMANAVIMVNRNQKLLNAYSDALQAIFKASAPGSTWFINKWLTKWETLGLVCKTGIFGHCPSTFDSKPVQQPVQETADTSEHSVEGEGDFSQQSSSIPLTHTGVQRKQDKK